MRRARHARIVVANHALVMAQAALGGLDDAFVPTRYVFDEGHHVFDAADAAFSAHLTGREAQDLRRWILGGEDARRGGVKSRARGLQRRAEELVAGHAEAETALAALARAARALPADGWEKRLGARAPHGPLETFFLGVQDHVVITSYSIHYTKLYDHFLQRPTDLNEKHGTGLVQIFRLFERPCQADAEPGHDIPS